MGGVASRSACLADDVILAWLGLDEGRWVAMGCSWGQTLTVDWSDQKGCFNLRMCLGLVRSSISKSKGSPNTELRSSGLDIVD